MNDVKRRTQSARSQQAAGTSARSQQAAGTSAPRQHHVSTTSARSQQAAIVTYVALLQVARVFVSPAGKTCGGRGRCLNTNKSVGHFRVGIISGWVLFLDAVSSSTRTTLPYPRGVRAGEQAKSNLPPLGVQLNGSRRVPKTEGMRYFGYEGIQKNQKQKQGKARKGNAGC